MHRNFFLIIYILKLQLFTVFHYSLQLSLCNLLVYKISKFLLHKIRLLGYEAVCCFEVRPRHRSAATQANYSFELNGDNRHQVRAVRGRIEKVAFELIQKILNHYEEESYHDDDSDVLN